MKMSGRRYMQVLRSLHAGLKPNWYLEIGTERGRSLHLANCNFVAVDPRFNIRFPVVGSGTEMIFQQKTSEDFFASDFLKRNGLSFDLAFLDGLHHFEVLLQDFISAEMVMNPGGLILLHDCCPSHEAMAVRDYVPGKNWTGDVWKTLMILRQARPDLQIDVIDAAPTGLVAIRNFSTSRKIPFSKYKSAISKWRDFDLSDFEGGLAGYYEQFPLVPVADFLASVMSTPDSGK